MKRKLIIAAALSLIPTVATATSTFKNNYYKDAPPYFVVTKLQNRWVVQFDDLYNGWHTQCDAADLRGIEDCISNIWKFHESEEYKQNIGKGK